MQDRFRVRECMEMCVYVRALFMKDEGVHACVRECAHAWDGVCVSVYLVCVYGVWCLSSSVQ